MKKTILMLVPLFLLTLTFCKEDEPDMMELNIVETAQENSDLSILVDALIEADLVSTLEGAGPFTVFAPSNTAFQALLDSDPSWNTLADIPDNVLTSVLLFHVLNGEVTASDLSDTYVSTLSTGPNNEAISLKVDVTGGVMFNGSAEPITTDVMTSNGVVHIIDEVMLPPNLPAIAVANSNFSTLVGALLDTRHTTDYVSVLSGTGPFTVFAPTNAAFQALLDTDPMWNSTADIPIGTLEAVLNYHVLAGANVQSDELNNGDMVEMFSGDTVTVDLSSGAQLQTGSGQTVNIIVTDVQGTNGVVHAVDAVLLP